MVSLDNATSSRRTVNSTDENVDTGKGYLWDRKRLQLENRKVKSQRILKTSGLRADVSRLAQTERTPLMVSSRCGKVYLFTCI